MSIPSESTDGPVWRRETEADQEFLFAVYAGSRAEELDRAGWSTEFRARFLEQQFDAMTRGYATAFPEADRWVIEQGGERRATVIVSRTGEEHRVVYIAVLPAARGHGLGTAMIERLKRDAASAGKPLRLQAFPDSAAIGWYRRMGFVEVGANGVRVQLEWSPAV